MVYQLNYPEHIGESKGTEGKSREANITLVRGLC